MINIKDTETGTATANVDAIRQEGATAERQRIGAILALAKGGGEKVQARATAAISNGDDLAGVAVEISALREQETGAPAANKETGAPAIATASAKDAGDDAYWARVKSLMTGVSKAPAPAGGTK